MNIMRTHERHAHGRSTIANSITHSGNSYFNVPATSEIYPNGIPTIKTLDNGIRIAVEEIEGMNRAYLRIVVHAGSLDDIIPGSVHFTEHMVFNGTKNRTEKQITKESRLAAAHINASTGHTLTVFESSPLGENVFAPLDIFLDMLFNPTIQNFEREKHIILNELMRDENGHPKDCVHCQLNNLVKELWNNHPVYRPIIGTKESIQSIEPHHIEDVLKRLYTSDNVVISVAGKCKPDEIIRYVEKATINVKEQRKKTPLLPFKYSPTVKVEQSQKADLTVLYFVTDAPSERDKAGLCTVSLINSALGPRLMSVIRTDNGLAYGANSNFDPEDSRGQFLIGTQVDDTQSLQVSRMLLDETEKMKKEGLTDEEFLMVAADFRDHSLGNFDDPRYRAMTNALMLLDYNRFVPLNEVWEPIVNVNNRSIIEAANKLFDRKNLSLVGVGGENIPDNTKFEQILKN